MEREHMPPNIFGKRFLGQRRPAWWDLEGVHVVDDPSITVADAMKRAGLLYRIEKAPIEATIFGETIVPTDKRGRPARWVIAREPVDDDPQVRVFGYAGPDYEILQNADLAGILDPLVTGDNPRGVRYRLESVGALEHGQRTFISLMLSERTIRDDKYRNYLTVFDGKDGEVALRAALSPVRVECQNTWNAAIARAQLSLATPHIKVGEVDVKEHAAFLVGMVSQVDKRQEEMFQVMEAMSYIPASPSVVSRLVLAAFPEPKPSMRAQLALDISQMPEAQLLAGGSHKTLEDAQARHAFVQRRHQVFRDGAVQLIDRFNDRFPQFSGTLYSAVNGIIECSDWRDGLNDRSAAEQIMFGFRQDEKTRAYKEAVDYATEWASDYTDTRHQTDAVRSAVRLLEAAGSTR